LENGNGPLLDAIDEHAFDTRHVLTQPRHDIARRAVIEPSERKALDVGVELAAKVENNALLEVIIEEDAKRVQAILSEKRNEAEGHEGEQEVRAVLPDDLVNDPLRDRREDDDHERACHGAEERAKSQRGVSTNVG
jgi:hypothetical protein